MGFAPSFCAEAFCTFFFQGSLIFTCVFVGTRHSKSTRIFATMGRSEAGGMSKQPNKTAQVNKNTEVAVGRNPITGFLGRKAPKRRVGRPKTKKRQRVSLKKRGKFTS